MSPSLKRVLRPINIAFAVLIAIAFILGNAVGNVFISKKSEVVEGGRQDLKKVSPSSSPNKPVNLSDVPGADASDEEKAAFAKNIHEMAQEKSEVAVSECSFLPKAVRVREKSSLTFVNSDSVEHAITIVKKTIRIPAGGKETVVAQFEHGPGLYGIRCDEKEMAGFIELTAIEGK